MTLITSQFKLVFLSVLGLTLLNLLTAVVVSCVPQTPATGQIVTTTLDMFKVGCGAIFGLLGGKAL